MYILRLDKLLVVLSFGHLFFFEPIKSRDLRRKNKLKELAWYCVFYHFKMNYRHEKYYCKCAIKFTLTNRGYYSDDKNMALNYNEDSKKWF
jgi:hypothetical protein